MYDSKTISRNLSRDEQIGKVLQNIPTDYAQALSWLTKARCYNVSDFSHTLVSYKWSN